MNTRAFRNSLVRWFRSRAAVGAFLAALTSALLGAGLMIWANWDPASRASQVPAAIVNEDSPSNGAANIGQQFTDQILQSDLLGWVETDLATAEQGLANGTYLAILRLPENLSDTVATLDSATPKSAQVDLITNDANSYVANELVDTAFSGIDLTRDITLNFLNEVYDALPEVRDQGQQAVTGADQIQTELTAVAGSISTLSQTSADLSSNASSASASGTELATQTKAVETDVAAIVKTATDINTNVTAMASGITATDTTMARIQQELTAAGQTQFAAEVGAMRTAFQSSVAQPAITLAQLSTQLNNQASKAATDSTAVASKAASLSSSATAVSTSATAVSQESATVAATLNDKVLPATTELSTILAAAADKVPPVSAEQREAFTEVLADPVVVNDVRLNPLSGLGEGLSPLFIPAALFAAALITFLLLRPLMPRLLRAGVSPGTVVTTSYLPALTWGLAQVGVLLIGLLILGVRAAAWLPFIASLVLSIACFLALVQLLRVAFGRIGLYAGAVLLVVQVASAAGVFPVQTTAPVFQLLHPVMPMTYSADAIRRTLAGGPLVPNVAIDWAVLGGLTMVFLALSWALTNRARRLTVDQIIPEVTLR